MAATTKIILLVSLLLAADVMAQANIMGWRPTDVYVIIYATHDGKTGHAGIAVDKYQVKIRDCFACPERVEKDTVKTGQLLYFDLWPLNDRFDRQRVFEEVPAQFYRLPGSSAEALITTSSLLRKGIPHEQGYPCDGLLKIRTTPDQDRDLTRFLDDLADEQRSFHAIHFNCADYVELAVEFLLKKNIHADERVLLVNATTPNYLYRALAKMPSIAILRDPGKLVYGSFLRERIIKQ